MDSGEHVSEDFFLRSSCCYGIMAIVRVAWGGSYLLFGSVAFCSKISTICYTDHLSVYQSIRRIVRQCQYLDLLTCSHQQGEDVHVTCFFLRAVRGCCKKRLSKY